MRRAWLIAIMFSLAAHAALIVVSLQTRMRPPRAEIAPGAEGGMPFSVALVEDPVPETPPAEPEQQPDDPPEPEPDKHVVMVAPDPPSDLRPEDVATVIEPQTAQGPTEAAAADNGPPAGVEARSLARHNRPPSYPAIARRMGWEGTVLLDVEVDADGHVGHVTVARSSGHTVLDRAAIDAVRSWRFEPAQRLRKPVESLVRLPVRFRLLSP